jgi:16S rRNA (guanine966-N2)-methyltransferase
VRKNRSSAFDSVRIVGGQWRGRRIEVCQNTSVRPTPDRVRETLFNWLSSALPSARCLDLFSGTGVLGFEALSRGADEAWLIENDPRLVKSLEEQSILLDANARVIKADALEIILKAPSKLFDIIFVDPPYTMDLSEVLLQLSSWVSPDNLVYVERQAKPRMYPIEQLADSHPSAIVRKQGLAGQVAYGLLTLKK